MLPTWVRALLTILVMAWSAQPAHARYDLEIEWEVVNPFRFFTDAQETERHREAFAALTPRERHEPILNAERRLAKRYPNGWAANLTGATCWNARRNRHRCPEGSRYTHPKHHEVRVRVTGLPQGERVNCTWLTTPRGKRVGRGVAVTRACDEAAVLAIPFPRGAIVSVEIGGRQVARRTIKVRDLFIAGLGDSFGSGEGNPDVPVQFSRERSANYGRFSKKIEFAGYPARVGDWRRIGDRAFQAKNARWLDQACHRSLYSHQLRAALQLALEDPHRAVTFVGVACSGAEITKGLFLRYKGNEWVENPPDLSQIAAIAQAQCGDWTAPAKEYPEAYHMRGAVPDLQGGLMLRKCPRRLARKLDLIFVSIGGNDIGFARLVANAVLNDRTMLRRLGGWFGQVYGPQDVREPLSELRARYRALGRAFHNILHLPWKESDRVIVAAYPGMALLADGRNVCPDGRLGMDILPQYLLSAKRALAGERVAERLYRQMRKAARREGWRLADHHRKAFQGRGICAGAGSFTAADELRLPRKIDGEWDPYNPADFRPYASRKRWFRTPNDAFMTGNFHVTGSLLRRVLRSQNLTWTQLLLASTYSGAFHPTAEGHAAIADAVAREARLVLERRSGRHLWK